MSWEYNFNFQIEYIASWLLKEWTRNIWVLTKKKCHLLEGFTKQAFIITSREKLYFISGLYLNIQLAVFIVYFSLMD